MYVNDRYIVISTSAVINNWDLKHIKIRWLTNSDKFAVIIFPNSKNGKSHSGSGGGNTFNFCNYPDTVHCTVVEIVVTRIQCTVQW